MATRARGDARDGWNEFRSVRFVRFARASSGASPTASSGSFQREIIARPIRKIRKRWVCLTIHDSTNDSTQYKPKTNDENHEPRLTTTTTRSRVPLCRFNSARARPRLSPPARSPSPPFASTCALPRYVVVALIPFVVSLFFEAVWITVILFTHMTMGLDPTHVGFARYLSFVSFFKGLA